MKEKEFWVIALTQESDELEPRPALMWMTAFFECDADGTPMFFSTASEASAHKDRNEIDGKCFQIPTY